MYASFYRLNEKPFAITPDPRYLYMSERHAEALAHLMYGVTEAGGFIQLTGEVGTGKTTVVRSLLEQLPQHAEVALIINPRLTVNEFLIGICEEIGIALPANPDSSKALVDALNAYLLQAHAAGRRVVLIVDEAQNLSTEVLEQIRLLTNLETAKQKLLQIILIGQPELREILARSDLRQLAQRVTGRYHLEPLSRAETGGYVRHRLQVAGATGEIFSPGSIRLIHRLSGGVPRLINVIADRAMLGAYTLEEHVIRRALVRRAATEVYGVFPRAAWRLAAIAGLLISTVTLAAVVAWQLENPWAGAAPAPSATRLDGVATLATTPAPEPPVIPTASVEALPPELPVGEPQPMVEPEPELQPPLEPSLADFLTANAAAASTDSAFALLFDLWGASYVTGETKACDQALELGLKCVLDRGSWANMRRLNRPAIVSLVGADGTEYHAVLQSLNDDTAVLRLGDASQQISILSLSEMWFGDYLLLWRPQAGNGRTLSQGMRDDGVRWLRQRLGQLQGTGTESDSSYFDTELTDSVRQFQRQRRLTVDGIAGVRTQILLNSEVDIPGTPYLVEPSRG